MWNIKKLNLVIIIVLVAFVSFFMGYAFHKEENFQKEISISLNGDYRIDDNTSLGISAGDYVYYLYHTLNDKECNQGKFRLFSDYVVEFISGEYEGKIAILEKDRLDIYENGVLVTSSSQMLSSVTVPNQCPLP